MPLILMNLPPQAVSEADLAEIARIMPGYEVHLTQDRVEIGALCDEVEVLVGFPAGELLESAPNLRWYQQWMAGSDWLERHPKAVEQPFVLTNASGVHPVQITEHVLALMLAFVRRLPAAIHQQAQREWQAPPGETLSELYERTLVMVGLGAIGQRVGQVAGALGMRVLGVRRSAGAAPPGIEAVYTPDRLLEVLPQADFLVLAPPLTADTFHMIGAPQLEAMKPSVFIVNVGRGKLIDEAALVAALQDGRIGGAGLDVFETEPLPSDSPLWRMPNVIITAHYGGATPRYHERAMAIFLDNLRRYRDGLPLRNRLDKRTGLAVRD